MHDLNLAARFCDKIILMKAGKIFAAGQTITVLTAKNIQEVYAVEGVINYCKNAPYITPIAPLN